jgi:hypothetical protein
LAEGPSDPLTRGAGHRDLALLWNEVLQSKTSDPTG